MGPLSHTDGTFVLSQVTWSSVDNAAPHSIHWHDEAYHRSTKGASDKDWQFAGLSI